MHCFHLFKLELSQIFTGRIVFEAIHSYYIRLQLKIVSIEYRKPNGILKTYVNILIRFIANIWWTTVVFNCKSTTSKTWSNQWHTKMKREIKRRHLLTLFTILHRHHRHTYTHTSACQPHYKNKIYLQHTQKQKKTNEGSNISIVWLTLFPCARIFRAKGLRPQAIFHIVCQS